MNVGVGKDALEFSFDSNIDSDHLVRPPYPNSMGLDIFTLVS